MNDQTKTELEAAAFRVLRDHLRSRTDVQNIDMMIQSGFCRNCLARWYKEAADARGIDMDIPAARAEIYGMPYEEWRDTYQTEATEAQKEAYKKVHG
jgi:hypothetical protein